MCAFLDSTSEIKKGPSSSAESGESLFECNESILLEKFSPKRQGIHLKVSAFCKYVRKQAWL
jgi:hypothetical protein